MTTCPSCARRDFASSLRCQWCGTPLQAGVPVLTAHRPATSASLMAPSNAALDTPASPFVPDLAPQSGTSQPLAPNSTPLQNRSDLDEAKNTDLKKKFGPFLGAIIIALGKAKVLLAALKFGKLATTFGSMLVSIAFYAVLFGWKFALGFVLLIFVHELGHVIALKRRNIPIEGMFFIPFMGAAVSFKKRPRDPAVDAEISWAGPFAGLLGGAVCAGLFVATGNVFWMALAHVTFLLNLINLAPAVPLDGGWIVKAINPKFSLFGSLAGIALGLYLHSTMLAVIAGLGGINAYNALRHADDDFDKPDVSPQTRARITAAYLGLVLVLGGAIAYSTHVLHEDRAKRDALPTASTRSAMLSSSQEDAP